jgi:hypothetical protein
MLTFLQGSGVKLSAGTGLEIFSQFVSERKFGYPGYVEPFG